MSYKGEIVSWHGPRITHERVVEPSSAEHVNIDRLVKILVYDILSYQYKAIEWTQ
jgi:hypothetical protein